MKLLFYYILYRAAQYFGYPVHRCHACLIDILVLCSYICMDLKLTPAFFASSFYFHYKLYKALK